MKNIFNFLILNNYIFIYLFLISLNISSEQNVTLNSFESLYYEEKYFRFLANNYDNIETTDHWQYCEEEKGICFKAEKDFGSAIFLKDWSMYGFKLKKIVFRPKCSIQFENSIDNCHAEMWLYHTKDNGYYPPGRRIHLKQNYFVIIVPFLQSDDNNPSNDLILEFLRLGLYYETIKDIKNIEELKEIKVSPSKSVKLFQIIQNQPSYLFESHLPETGQDCLFLVFSQYHYISETDFIYLTKIEKKLNEFFGSVGAYEIKMEENEEYYRNWRNAEEMIPSVSLMMYNGSKYLSGVVVKTIIFLFFAFLF